MVKSGLCVNATILSEMEIRANVLSFHRSAMFSM